MNRKPATQTSYCPHETDEEITLSNYCEQRGLTHWHVPQETYTTSWKQKTKNKAMGVLEGVSDHWVILPPNSTRPKSLLVIELKRQFGNTPTDAQIKFLKDIGGIPNIGTVCCYGADEAIKVIEEVEKDDFTTFDKCNKRMYKIEENRKKRRKIPKKSQKSENDLPY